MCWYTSVCLCCLFKGVETSGTCVWYTSVCLCCLFQGVEPSDTCVGTPQYVCVGCFRELRRQARLLVHLSLFVLFQGVETSGTCAGATQSVCVVSGSRDVRHVSWYNSVCLCCFRELRCQARVLVHLGLFVLFKGVETSGTCVDTPQSVCVVSGS